MSDETISILLVEDDPVYPLLVRRMLESADGRPFTLEVRPTLASALEYLADRTPDVALLDLSLGDSDGLATVEAIRSARPDVVIVILSQSVDDSVVLEAVRLGAEDAMRKPDVTPESLALTLRRAVERERAQQGKEIRAGIARLGRKIEALRALGSEPEAQP